MTPSRSTVTKGACPLKHIPSGAPKRCRRRRGRRRYPRVALGFGDFHRVGDVSIAVGTVGPVRGTDTAAEDRDSRRGNDPGGRRTGHGRPIIRRTGPVVRTRWVSALGLPKSPAHAFSEGREGQFVADRGRPVGGRGGAQPHLCPGRRPGQPGSQAPPRPGRRTGVRPRPRCLPRGAGGCPPRAGRHRRPTRRGRGAPRHL